MTPARGSEVLYAWKEYGLFFKIIQTASGKDLWGTVGGKWRFVRKMSDGEYQIMFADLARDLAAGRIPRVELPA